MSDAPKGSRGPAPNDIRLRRDLGQPFGQPVWPAGHTLRAFTPADARDFHALLGDVFDDGSDGPFEAWWERLQGDPEYEAGLCFLVHDRSGRLVAAALCWNSAFVKDLAVRPEARRLGLGEALMLHAFTVLRARGAPHVDLKTNTVENADAVRLYRRLGMAQVAWEG